MTSRRHSISEVNRNKTYRNARVRSTSVDRPTTIVVQMDYDDAMSESETMSETMSETLTETLTEVYTSEEVNESESNNSVREVTLGGQGGGGYERWDGKSYKSNPRLTMEEMRSKLKGFSVIKESLLANLRFVRPFNVWIKYVNKKTKAFRSGGVVTKVGPIGEESGVPEYLALASPNLKVIWSVQIKDNYLFMRTEALEILKYASREMGGKEVSRTMDEVREEKVKEKLYRLFKDGRLKLSKD